ncbi:MAG: hypothetical protein H0U10_16575, partial [Chloroflexia bacterium]|nr:hypothetical protein [Chloroflexia bacterium]
LRETPSLDGALIVGQPQGSLLVVTGPVVEGSSLLWYPVQSAVDPALTGFIAADLVGTEP